MLALGRGRGGGTPKLTPDGEGGRGLHLAHAVLGDAGVGALVSTRRLLDPQQVVLLVVFNLVPEGAHRKTQERSNRIILHARMNGLTAHTVGKAS